jgi:hypothetical protein
MGQFTTWVVDKLHIMAPDSAVDSTLADPPYGPDYTATDPSNTLQQSADSHQGQALIDPTKLEGPLKWAAAGFTAIAAVLTFLGIKEGVLDQALRLNPAATLCVFLLIGFGVVAALFVPSVRATSRLRLWPVVLAIISMILITALFLPNLGILERTQRILQGSALAPPGGALRPLLLFVLFTLVGVMASVAGWLLTRRPSSPVTLGQKLYLAIALTLASGLGVFLWQPWRNDATTAAASTSPTATTTVLTIALSLGALLILTVSFVTAASLPTAAGLVILAVSATSLGLYGATKLAVQSKMLAVLPQVTATLEATDGGQTNLVVTAKAGRMRGLGLLIDVSGALPIASEDSALGIRTSSDADSLGFPPRTIWREVVQPNALDDIDRTIKIPVTPVRWSSMTVGYCLTSMSPTTQADDGLRCLFRRTFSPVVRLRNRASEAGMAQIGGSVKPADGSSLSVDVTGSDVGAGQIVQVALCRTVGGKHERRLALETLSPNSSGSLSWSAKVPLDGDNTDGLSILYRVCPAGVPCETPWATAAAYTLP